MANWIQCSISVYGTVEETKPLRYLIQSMMDKETATKEGQNLDGMNDYIHYIGMDTETQQLNNGHLDIIFMTKYGIDTSIVHLLDITDLDFFLFEYDDWGGQTNIQRSDGVMTYMYDDGTYIDTLKRDESEEHVWYKGEWWNQYECQDDILENKEPLLLNHTKTNNYVSCNTTIPCLSTH